MGRFLRDNWIWIVAPLVIVALVCLLIAWFSSADPVQPIQYPF